MRNRTKTNLCSFMLECCLGRNRNRFMPYGFSIERVLLIIFLIVLVISIILPSIPHRAKSYAYVVKQEARFRYIESCLKDFKDQVGYYPPSDALDPTGKAYCGAMKFCEALIGQDFMGFHRDSVFRSDGMDASGVTQLYPKKTNSNNLSARGKSYLSDEDFRICSLREMYAEVGQFDGDDRVVCDVYANVNRPNSGKEVGMPLLYYKANISKTAHDVNDPDNPENIYNYKDNHALIGLGVPGKPSQKHPLYENPRIFYEMTKDYREITQSKPNNAETFILLSAGKDGLYGTKDDIANFEIEWKPQ